MPYTGAGPYPVGSFEDMVADAAWGGQEGRTTATPAEQAQAYAELQATDFNDAGFPTPGGTVLSRISQWAQQNQTAVYLGIGALVLMSVFKGGRR